MFVTLVSVSYSLDESYVSEMFFRSCYLLGSVLATQTWFLCLRSDIRIGVRC